MSASDVWEQAERAADLVLRLPGDVPMFFRRVPKGSFRMGARGFSAREEPVHRVVIDREFYLGTFVVTQEQYRAVASRCPALRERPDPSNFKGPRCPVEQVSWEDASAFCGWLARWKELPPDIAQVRLPSEAEWEYACRAGTETEYYNGDGEASLAEVGWFENNSGEQTHVVDELPEPHLFGLYGMHGNVWEWCEDVYDPTAYRKRPDGWLARAWALADAGRDAQTWTSEPANEGNVHRVLRGGSWYSPARGCRSAARNWGVPGVRYWRHGFRVCLVRGPAARQASQAAEPVPGDGGRGTRPESDGAGGAPAGVRDLAQASFPRKATRKSSGKAKRGKRK